MTQADSAGRDGSAVSSSLGRVPRVKAFREWAYKPAMRE